MKRFTAKRAEQQMSVCTHLFGASVGRKAVCGFTLVETLVAITILTFAVTGTFLTANSAIVAAATSRDRLTASYLAQEGIEYVRKLRDDTYLQTYSEGGADVSGRAWSAFYTGPVTGCVRECDAATLGLPPPPSPFTRRIRIDQMENEIRITSIVGWNFHLIPYKVIIVDDLTEWQ